MGETTRAIAEAIDGDSLSLEDFAVEIGDWRHLLPVVVDVSTRLSVPPAFPAKRMGRFSRE